MKRLSIAMCMAAVGFLAVGSAALTHPTELWASSLFTLAVALLTWASVAAVIRPRAFWTGFAAFGWVYLILSLGIFGARGIAGSPFPPPPTLVTSFLIESLEARVIQQTFRNNPTPPSTPKPATPAGNIVTFTNGSPTPIQTFTVRATMFAHGEFHQIGHSLLALLVAMIGGFVASEPGRKR